MNEFYTGRTVRTGTSIFLPKRLRNLVGVVLATTVCQFGDEWVVLNLGEQGLAQVLPELISVKE